MNKILAITLIVLAGVSGILGTSFYNDYQISELRAYEMASDACTALDTATNTNWDTCMRAMHYY